jgi:ADP-heptose:LPS heptosyltransferase
MPDIAMQLPDPSKASVLGLPAAPKNDPAKINNPFYIATEFEREGKRKEAEHIYLELLNQDFGNPVLTAALGMCYATQEKNGLAFLLLNHSLSNIDTLLDGFKRVGITPKSNDKTHLDDFVRIKKSEVLNAIGTCYKHENKITEARDFFMQAQADIPPNPDIQNNLGTLYINEGKPAEAQAHLDLALSIDPNHAQAHWNKSLTYLELGDYERGWPEYDWGIKAKVRVDRNYTNAALPYWDGTPGKRVIVYGEQGIGDEILFASVLPDFLRDCPDSVFECHRKLHILFANSFPSIDIYPTREDEVISWPLKPDGSLRYNFDAKCAIGSLPQFYRKSIGEFPGTAYITPTPASELKWNEALDKLPPGPKIGISWIGGHKKTRIEVRSIELEKLLPILSQNAQFISLQYTDQEDEIAAFEAKHGIHIHQFPDAAKSPVYDDCAGLVANLDLVITVCTSVVHLAGSMGVPVWVMTPSRPAWRYRLDLDTMPWYRDTLLFRQAPGDLDWAPVVNEVADNLRTLLEVQPNPKKEAA